MIAVKVTTIGKINPLLVINKERLIMDSIPDIGVEAANYMKNFINISKKRKITSTGNLENSITVTKSITPNKVAIGIGRISTLKRKAPYWATINYGARIGTNKREKQFVPGAFIAGDVSGLFTYIKKYPTGYLMPRGLGTGVVIKPMHYIERTQKWLKETMRKRFAPTLLDQVKQFFSK